MITESLFERAIQSPLIAGGDRLIVVSGVASAEMALRVMLFAAERRHSLTLELTIGLTSEEGISRQAHEDLVSLQNSSPAPKVQLDVRYALAPTSVNSNVFVWCEGEEPLWAWTGSSRFIQRDFGLGMGHRVSRKNVLAEVEPASALRYIREIQAHTVQVHDPSVPSAIPLSDERDRSLVAADSDEFAVDRTVALPLITLKRGPSRGSIHSTAGLNWGQRAGREPNQAYIPIPKEIREGGFFPPRGTVFRIRTDDGRHFLARTAQQGDKALETPQNNSILGEYFRMRLGVPLGAPVQLSDLLTFGSRFVLVHRLLTTDDNEGYDYVLEYSAAAESLGAEEYGL